MPGEKIMKYSIVLIAAFVTVQTFAQAEFKITIDQFKWENPSGSKVDLTIFLTIKNVGNKSGWCEDLKGIYLDCSQYNYYFGTHLTTKDYSNNIVNDINPSGSVEAYITFTIPKDADDISLRFTEFYGGASRYITESYYKSLIKEKLNRFEMFVSEGDLRMIQNYPEEAVTQYKAALDVDVNNNLKSDVRIKLSEAYYRIGEKYFDSKIWGLAIDNYNNALTLSNNTETRNRLGEVYQIIGDEKYSMGLKKEALTNYERSLLYKEDARIRIRKNELSAEVQKKDKKHKKVRQENAQYQKLLNPKVGVRFGGGISFQTKNNGRSSAPFWSGNLGIISKLIVDKSSAFNLSVNTELGVSGLITDNSNSNFIKYYNFPDSIERGETALSNEYSFNTGIVMGFMSESIMPLVSINFGIYALNLKYNSYSSGSVSSSSSSVDALYWGFGPKIELGLVFGRKFYIGYSFKSYSISSSTKFIDGRYSGHNVGLGIMFY